MYILKAKHSADKKDERKAKSSSSFSGFSSPSVMPILLSELEPSSFDFTVTVTNAS